MVRHFDQNPFVYGTPLSPHDAIPRDEEVEIVLRLALGGQHTRLSAARGYGKTTLIGQVRAAADRLGINTVRVDLAGISSLGDVAVRLEHGYAAAHGPVKRLAAGLLREFERGEHTALGPSAESGPRAARATHRMLLELLDLPLASYKHTRVRTLVILDEFQDVLHADGDIEAVIRSGIQHHAKAASYLFAGSSSQMLIHRARPLVLGPLSDRAVARFIADGFARTGRATGSVLNALLPTAGGHPQRMMLLAHHLWEHTPRGEASTEATWQQALAASYAELHGAFASACSGPDERSVLAALAWGRRPLLADETLQHFGLSKNRAETTLAQLIGSGELRRTTSGDVEFVDPLYGRWIGAGRRVPRLAPALRSGDRFASPAAAGGDDATLERLGLSENRSPILAIRPEGQTAPPSENARPPHELRRGPARGRHQRP